MKKRKSLSPDKILFPARRACSLKCKGRKASGCISGRSHLASRRAFCKGVRPHSSHEKSPVKQDISRNGISYSDVCRGFWNSREMAPWERNTITPGYPCTSWLFAALRVFGSLRKAELRLLLARKEMNRKYVISNIITFSKYFVDV